MDLSRRNFLKTGLSHVALMFAGYLSLGAGVSRAASDDVATGANGLYVQPWFEDSFLDLAEELEIAAGDGKQLVLIYEQAGCPYCKELHKVNLAKPEIAKFLQDHFRVVQIDIRGSREVTDFAGKAMTEKDFAQAAQIHFTPTLSFFPKQASKAIGKVGRDAEAFRLTGYWKPFHFETVLRFVHDGSYKDENLQSYLRARIERLKGQGVEPQVH